MKYLFFQILNKYKIHSITIGKIMKFFEKIRKEILPTPHDVSEKVLINKLDALVSSNEVSYIFQEKMDLRLKFLKALYTNVVIEELDYYDVERIIKNELAITE